MAVYMLERLRTQELFFSQSWIPHQSQPSAKSPAERITEELLVFNLCKKADEAALWSWRGKATAETC